MFKISKECVTTCVNAKSMFTQACFWEGQCTLQSIPEAFQALLPLAHGSVTTATPENY